MLQSLREELRYSLRLLRGQRGFTILAVLTLALGIGANTAVFSILDLLLVRKLPVERPDELVLLDAAGTMGKAESWPVLALDQFRGVGAFAGALAFAPIEFEHESETGAVRGLRAEMVSGDYFSLLGVKPYAGRLIDPEDDRGAFGDQVAVLSYEFWRREFRGDAAVVGKMVPIHHMTYTVVGVAPPEFVGMVVGEKPDFYMPLKAGRPLTSSDPYSPDEWVTIVARLRPGVSAVQAAVASEPLLGQIAGDAGVPEAERKQAMARMVLTSAARGISGSRERFSLPAIILTAIAALVLLVACGNVAGFLLAEAEARYGKRAIRLRVATSRLHMALPFLAHALALGLTSLIVALPLAHWWSRMLACAIVPAGPSPTLTGGAEGRVLVFALAITFFAALLCLVAPMVVLRPARLRANASVK